MTLHPTKFNNYIVICTYLTLYIWFGSYHRLIFTLFKDSTTSKWKMKLFIVYTFLRDFPIFIFYCRKNWWPYQNRCGWGPLPVLYCFKLRVHWQPFLCGQTGRSALPRRPIACRSLRWGEMLSASDPFLANSPTCLKLLLPKIQSCMAYPLPFSPPDGGQCKVARYMAAHFASGICQLQKRKYI